jgi:phosphotransferase system  glucose/maltose/N-acetylglucosamine-specific IIC component
MRLPIVMLMLFYGTIAAMVYVKWHAIFRKDQAAYTEDRTFSTFVLIVASLFWVVTVPIAWIERRKRPNGANISEKETQ